jgi:hypothetical protein
MNMYTTALLLGLIMGAIWYGGNVGKVQAMIDGGLIFEGNLIDR